MDVHTVSRNEYGLREMDRSNSFLIWFVLRDGNEERWVCWLVVIAASRNWRVSCCHCHCHVHQTIMDVDGGDDKDMVAILLTACVDACIHA